MMDFNTPIDMSKIGDVTPFEFGDFDKITSETGISAGEKPKKQVAASHLQMRPRRGRPPKGDVVVYKPTPSRPKRQKHGGAESLSEEDKAYIDHNARKETVQDMASHLGKYGSTVRRYMEAHGLLGENDTRDARVKKAIINELHNQAFWYAIKKSYNEEEIAYFEEEWYLHIEQLDDDVTATERTQVKQLIEKQILMDRLSIAEQKINNEIEDIDEEIAELRDKLPQLGDSDESEVLKLQNEITTLIQTQGALQASKNTNGKERDIHQKAHAKLVEQLDVSRVKRVEKYNISDKTWSKMLLEIKENPSLKDQMAAVAYLSMLATEYMRGKLTQPYTYADGDVHAPLLIPQGIVNEELTSLVEQLYVPHDDKE